MMKFQKQKKRSRKWDFKPSTLLKPENVGLDPTFSQIL